MRCMQKTFNQSAILAAHMRVHAKGNHFDCKICNCCFELRSEYLVHMSEHSVASVRTNEVLPTTKHSLDNFEMQSPIKHSVDSNEVQLTTNRSNGSNNAQSTTTRSYGNNEVQPTTTQSIGNSRMHSTVIEALRMTLCGKQE